MKRILAVALILGLLLGLSVPAGMAETTVTALDMSARSMELNKESNTLLMQTEDRSYCVIDAEGNVLSEKYGNGRVRDGFFLVNDAVSGQEGALDGQGQVVVPTQYGDIDIISSRWVAGILLTPATAENYDYKSFSGEGYFLVDKVDLYYRGELKGTLSRMEYKSASAYGDYLMVRTRDDKYTFYNKELVPSPREAEYSSEYNEDYKAKTIWHQGSGQAAFTEGCTLTDDEVAQNLWEIKGTIRNLQGEAVGDVSGYASVYKVGYGLVRVRNGANLYGLADVTGKELVPCQYEELTYDLQDITNTGYAYAVKDGKAGFVNIHTGEETGFVFSKDAVREYQYYLRADDLDGTSILISAVAGRLPAQYKDVRLTYTGYGANNPMAVVLDAEDHAGVIGLQGEEVIPLDGTYDSVYDLDISNDGSVILGQKDYRSYVIYRVNYEIPAAGGTSAAAPAGDTWTCENGHEGNTGKFCSECGAPQPTPEPAPADDGTWTCENGHEGNTGNFCSECGAPRPAAEEGPWTCVNGHEGNTGKFCSECGAPRP